MEEWIGKTVRLRSFHNQQHILAQSEQNGLITMITDHDHSRSEIMQRTSFVMVQGLVGVAGTVSFRPMKSPNKYIRVRDDKLYVEGMILVVVVFLFVSYRVHFPLLHSFTVGLPSAMHSG